MGPSRTWPRRTERGLTTRASGCLAFATPGERYRVTRILFDMVEDRCSSLGIREGETVRCRLRTARAVKLELEDGRPVTLEAPYAAFVEVGPPAESTPVTASV